MHNESFQRGMGLFLSGDAVRYLRTVKLSTNPHRSIVNDAPGIYSFSIEHTNNGLDFVKKAEPSGGNWGSFQAYWCPNVQKKAPQVTLGREASVFLTAAITGCVLEINGDRITHHDGHSSSRQKVLDMHLPKGGKSGRRYWDNGDAYASTVIGVNLSGRWRFYQQSWNYGDTFPLAVGAVSEI